MVIDVKNISGWKWDNLTDANNDLIACRNYFNLPQKIGDQTTDIFVPLENKDSQGNILFYYVGDSYPSQLSDVPAMGAPINFDINVIIE